jgi:hydrogenase assembly chaperone HypC/HupF
MCFATPEQVVELAPGVAVIERAGARIPILLHLLDEPVAVGDWLAVQAQRHAVAKLSAEEADELMALYDQIGAQLAHRGSDLASRALAATARDTRSLPQETATHLEGPVA